MALEKPTRGKPVRESIFIFQERFIIYSNTQKISNQLISTRKINFCLDLRVEQQKSNFDFFMFFASIYVPLYELYIQIVWTLKSVQFFFSKIVSAALKTVLYGLYGLAINAVVYSLIFMPSLLLSFPSICVLQNFSSCSGKMELSLFSLSALSSHFNLQKWGKMPFPCLFEKTLGWV